MIRNCFIIVTCHALNLFGADLISLSARATTYKTMLLLTKLYTVFGLVHTGTSNK